MISILSVNGMPIFFWRMLSLKQFWQDDAYGGDFQLRGGKYALFLLIGQSEAV
jgi:hypothetical protein